MFGKPPKKIWFWEFTEVYLLFYIISITVLIRHQCFPGKNGYIVFKSTPIGSVYDTLPYLYRRAHENKSALEFRQDKLQVDRELRRRFLTRNLRLTPAVKTWKKYCLMLYKPFFKLQFLLCLKFLFYCCQTGTETI